MTDNYLKRQAKRVATVMLRDQDGDSYQAQAFWLAVGLALLELRMDAAKHDKEKETRNEQ